MGPVFKSPNWVDPRVNRKFVFLADLFRSPVVPIANPVREWLASSVPLDLFRSGGPLLTSFMEFSRRT
jgi:hypothetical protein